MYRIVLSSSVMRDLREIRAFDRSVILEALEKHLTCEPDVATRTRKLLLHLIPPFEAVAPVWELRVGVYRVFYDVDREADRVFVRAVRRKPPHKRTKEIL